jgi:hypothetical protein
MVNVAMAVVAGLGLFPGTIGNTKGSLRAPQGEWTGCPGTGDVRKWEVNEVANRIRVTDKSGARQVFRLRQFEFENGDHFTRSVLEMGRGRLLVTHQHGAYTVSSRGKVLAEMNWDSPKVFEVTGRTVRALGRTEAMYDNVLTARGWNGQTAIVTADLSGDGYVVLVSPSLRRIAAVTFIGRQVRSMTPVSGKGWRIELAMGKRVDRAFLSNIGSIKLDDRKQPPADG